MNSIRVKVIYKPFFFLFIVTAILSVIFKWFFSDQINFINKTQCSMLFDPMLISALLCVVVMGKRLGILNCRRLIYRLSIIGVMTICMGITITYLQKITPYFQYKIKTIHNFSELTTNDTKGFIDIKHVHAIRRKMVSGIGFLSLYRTGGEIIQIYRHIAIPLNNSLTVWVGFPFDEHTSLNPSDADKTRTFNKLNATSQQFIQSYQFSDVRYFELVPDSDYRNNYIDLIYKKYPFLKGRSLTILSPTRNTKNENVVFELVFLTLFIAFGAMCIFVLVELQGLNLTKVEEYIDSPELGKSLR